MATRQLELQPDVGEQLAHVGFADLRNDTVSRLRYLAEALALGIPQILEDELAWQKIALTARGVSVDYLRVNLECMVAELTDSLPNGSDLVCSYLNAALHRLERAPTHSVSLIVDADPHADLARRYLLALLEARRDDAIALILNAFESGLPLLDIHTSIQRAQAELGRMWQTQEIHVGEEHLATAATRQALALLHARAPRAETNGRQVLCASVGGDLHDVGLQVVTSHLEIAGFGIVQLGPSVPAPDLVRSTIDFGADLIALSANLPIQMRALAATIRELRAQEQTSRIPVMVGGPPFAAIPELWHAVGADGCGLNAAEAVDVAVQLTNTHAR